MSGVDASTGRGRVLAKAWACVAYRSNRHILIAFFRSGMVHNDATTTLETPIRDFQETMAQIIDFVSADQARNILLTWSTITSASPDILHRRNDDLEAPAHGSRQQKRVRLANPSFSRYVEPEEVQFSPA